MKFHRNCRFVVFTLVFMFLIGNSFAEDTLEILSPNYFNEQDQIYDDIHFLEKEQLSFNFCTDINSSDIKFIINCDTTEDSVLDISKNTEEDGCYFSNFNLDEATCDNFDLEISFKTNNKDKKIKRSFQKQRQSKLINYVLGLDYNLLNPVDLSYYLVVQNDVEGLNSLNSVDAYEKLKNDRNNDNKCWPSSSCTISDTSKIVRNLELANFDSQTRLLDDGKKYLEDRVISNDNNPLRFVLEADGDLDSNQEISCTLEIDDEDELDYDLDDNETTIDKYASETIIFTCNQTVEDLRLTIYNIDGGIDEIENYDEETGFTYNLDQFSCVGTGTTCNYENTIDTLNTYGDQLQTLELLDNYIDSLITESSDLIYLGGGNNNNEDTGKFLYHREQEDLEDFLKFRQNNDGSWGSNSRYDKIIETAWSILGLQSVTPDSEYIEDGKKWVYFNEPESGWGSVEKNSLAYLAIKEQIKPYVRINAMNEVREVAKFTIENPTIYNIKNLKLELSEEIINHVSYAESLGDLDGEQSTTFNITINEDFYGSQSGTMKLTGIDGKNQEIELLEIPINLEGPLPINLLGGFYFVTSQTPYVSLKIEKNIPSFSVGCSYQNPFTSKDETITVNQGSETIEIENLALSEGNFTVTVACEYDGTIFELPVEFSVLNAMESFYLESDNVTINELENFSVLLTSTSNEIQDITIKVDGDYIGLIEPAEDFKVIAPNDERELFINIKNPAFLEALGNTSSGNLIVKSSSGFSKIIPMYVNLSIEDSGGEISKWIWAIIIILIMFGAFVAFRFYELKKYEEMPEEHFEDHDEEIYLDE